MHLTSRGRGITKAKIKSKQRTNEKLTVVIITSANKEMTASTNVDITYALALRNGKKKDTH